MSALSLTAAEQAGVAAADTTLDQAFAGGMNNPDTSQNSAALTGYSAAASAGSPPQDYRPTARTPFRESWVALVRALASFVEAFTEVGSGGAAPAFQNSWGNSGGGTNTCAFYKDPFSTVRLKGRVTGGTSGAVIFTLPAGYRPPLFMTDVVDAAGATAQVSVSTGGNVSLNFTGSPSYFSLDGVNFRAMQ